MNLLDIVLYFAASLIGGAINSVAGGGTFLVFPLLIINGMGSIQANIMSTMALWPGAVASSIAYRSEHADIDRKNLIRLIIISMGGSIVGTFTLLSTPEVTFKALVPWLLLAATFIFTFGARIFPPPLRGRAGWGVTQTLSERGSPPTLILPLKGGGYILQFLIAIYGGYFGAGIGILMLAMLQLMGFSSIHQMNALKTILGSAINAVAWIVFAFSGKVIWPLALIMITGSVLGGYFGARLALKISPAKIRRMVSLIGFAMTAYFFIHGV